MDSTDSNNVEGSVGLPLESWQTAPIVVQMANGFGLLFDSLATVDAIQSVSDAYTDILIAEQHARTRDYWVSMMAVLTGPPILFFVAGALLGWIWRGFRLS